MSAPYAWNGGYLKTSPTDVVEALGLNGHICKSLRRAGIRTVHDLTGLTHNALLQIKGIARPSARAIIAELWRDGHLLFDAEAYFAQDSTLLHDLYVECDLSSRKE